LWSGHAWKQDGTFKVRQLVAGVLGSLYLHTAADLNTAQAELELQIQALTRAESPTEKGKLAAMQDQSKLLSAQMEALRARAKGLRSAKRMNNVLTFASSEMGITSDQWDRHPWLLSVQGGVIDLQTGVRRDGEPTDYIRTTAPTEWRGLDAPCPRFLRFLAEVFEDKEDRQELMVFLQRLLGYGITGLVTHHIFPILYGEEGRNGKDTLLNTLKNVLGPHVGAVSNDVFIAQDKQRSAGAATPHLCDLQGKRLVWGSETREGDRFNIAQVKQLTGDSEISARQLHGKQYAFAPTHKMLLMTNFKPHADARDKAFWARACLIEFGIRFVEHPQAPNERQADLTLKDALRQESAGILAWLVRGCLDWQEHGLEIPESIRIATEKYQEDEDKLLLFLSECCILSPTAYVKAGAFYEAYCVWHTSQFGGRGVSGKLFANEMNKRFEKGRTETMRFYKGVGLLLREDPNTLFNTKDHPHIAFAHGRGYPDTNDTR